MNKLALSLTYAIAFVGVHNVAFGGTVNMPGASTVLNAAVSPAVCASAK